VKIYGEARSRVDEVLTCTPRLNTSLRDDEQREWMEWNEDEFEMSEEEDT